MNLGNPSTLVVILDVVNETLDGLAAHGVEPDLIVAFRGPSVRFVTTDESKIPLEQVEAAQALTARRPTVGRTADQRQRLSPFSATR